MTLPIRRILWAGNDPNHHDHLHVEGDPASTGHPPYYNPGMTASVTQVYDALIDEFGTAAYYKDSDAGSAGWTHMGWYNRRKIAGSNTWSQHAWANALDVGPYLGVAAQQKFYDYLTQEEDDMPTPEEVRKIVREELDRTSDGKPATKYSVWGLMQAVFSGKIGNSGLSAAQNWDETLKAVRRIEKKVDEL